MLLFFAAFSLILHICFPFLFKNIAFISTFEHETAFQERVKREKAAKEELIHRSPYYQNWPMVFIFKLTSQLKWKKFPKDYGECDFIFMHFCILKKCVLNSNSKLLPS